MSKILKHVRVIKRESNRDFAAFTLGLGGVLTVTPPSHYTMHPFTHDAWTLYGDMQVLGDDLLVALLSEPKQHRRVKVAS